MAENKLTDASIRALKPRDKRYKVSDGKGLYVLVMPNGSKLFRMKYLIGGTERTLSFGQYPDVTLAMARGDRDDARIALSNGTDPMQAKRDAQRGLPEVAAMAKFRTVADEWFANRTEGWVDTYADRVRARFVDDVYPTIGDRDIRTIAPLDCLEIARKIESRGAVEMARRIINHMGSVFRFGIASGRCAMNPTADIKDALANRPPVQHRARLGAEELPGLFQALQQYQGEKLTRLALRFAMHTFVRTSEIRFAQWSEFENLAGAEPIWRISSKRMKMRNEHIVPLTPQVVELLRQIKAEGGAEFLFQLRDKRKSLSENTMIYAFYRMGYHKKATIHGLRGTASTILYESGKFQTEWIERQLAHVDTNTVRAAYNSAEYLGQRRSMMNWWSDYLDAVEESSVDEFDRLIG